MRIFREKIFRKNLLRKLFLRKHKVILVTEGLEAEMIERCNMIPARTPDEALEIAYGIKGRDAEVVVIPDGVSVLVSEARDR